MKNILLFTIFSSTLLFSQTIITDANIVGHVLSEGEHIPFVHIVIKGTTIRTSTDESGHYQLINLPPGEITIQTQALGLRSK